MIRTGPFSGVLSSGVMTVASPTFDWDGQLSDWYALTGQTLPRAPTLGPSGVMSVTFADLVAASPGSWSMIVVSGGWERFAVCPGAPTIAVSFGLNGSWSH